MHCLSIFITTLCVIFLRHSEFYLPKSALRKQKAIERLKRHIELAQNLSDIGTSTH